MYSKLETLRKARNPPQIERVVPSSGPRSDRQSMQWIRRLRASLLRVWSQPPYTFPTSTVTISTPLYTGKARRVSYLCHARRSLCRAQACASVKNELDFAWLAGSPGKHRCNSNLALYPPAGEHEQTLSLAIHQDQQAPFIRVFARGLDNVLYQRCHLLLMPATRCLLNRCALRRNLHTSPANNERFDASTSHGRCAYMRAQDP